MTLSGATDSLAIREVRPVCKTLGVYKIEKVIESRRWVLLWMRITGVDGPAGKLKVS